MPRGKGSKGEIRCLRRTSTGVVHNAWLLDSLSIRNSIHPVRICFTYKFVQAKREWNGEILFLLANNCYEFDPLIIIYILSSKSIF